MRQLRDIDLRSEMRRVSARIVSGATLASVLRANLVDEREVDELVAKAAALFDLRKVRADQPYRIEQAIDGRLRLFEYEIDGDRLLQVARPAEVPSEPDLPQAGSDDLVARILPIAKTAQLAIISGSIDRDTPSLFEAMEAAGESVELSINLASVFAGEIDFNVDLRPGDRFALLVEKQYRDDHVFAGYGPVLAAEFENAGHTMHAVRFAPDGAPPSYFDERGVSMRRFFLQSPLKFVPVVTSGFSTHRLHPILREYRPHLGVDYRAPFGAPVVAVADGVVLDAGANGGAGRMVHLRHANGFETEYLHLSQISVRRGQRVRQGDLVGRVGASGLATGPHLDYRLKHDGAFINPLTARRSIGPADPVPSAQMAAFSEARDRLFAELASPPSLRASSPASDHEQ